MKRSDIAGWTWRLGNLELEIVTVHHIIRVISCWRRTRELWHLEW
jgi:hypothetical protein